MKTTCDKSRKQAHTFGPQQVIQTVRPQDGKGASFPLDWQPDTEVPSAMWQVVGREPAEIHRHGSSKNVGTMAYTNKENVW